MEGSSRLPRTPSRLSDSLHQRLNMYALAASAAGVGVLALSQPADAKIVYTKTHKVIQVAGQFVDIDFNHDGIVDFWVAVVAPRGAYGVRLAAYRAWSSSPNRVFQTSKGGAAAYPAGVRIGPKGHQASPLKIGPYFGDVMEFVTRGENGNIYGGPWLNVENRYLGLSFVVNGKTHYGWARLNAAAGHYGVRGTLTGYAYETVPNKPIITGKTKGPDVVAVHSGSLGSLALGRR